MVLALLLLACSAGTDAAKSDDTSAGTDSSAAPATAADSGTDSGTDSGPACSVVNPGDDWGWLGECPGMPTPVAITVDGCPLTLDYEAVGGMTMGMPYSATIEGDIVTFANDDSVKDCTGTIATADKIEGECRGGCTFTLKR